LLAARLGWSFTDVDAAIVAGTGTPVAELFRTRGEAAFRELESRLTAQLCSLDGVVIAPGAGWAAQPGSLDALPLGTAVVWLRVSPAEALGRLRGSPETRPLLAGDDPDAALRALDASRTPSYARSDLVIDVDDRTAAEIAEVITEWLHRRTP
jgi:shikimate kinase